MPALPSTIPFCAVNFSYSEELEDNKVSFKPAVGRPKERRRSTIADTLIGFSRSMTRDQWFALRTFYRTTLQDGVLEFTANHPDTAAPGTFTFTRAPSVQKIGTAKYMVQISLRQIA